MKARTAYAFLLLVFFRYVVSEKGGILRVGVIGNTLDFDSSIVGSSPALSAMVLRNLLEITCVKFVATASHRYPLKSVT